MILPKDGERNILLVVCLLLAPDTDCGESDFLTVYVTRNRGGQARGCRAGLGLSSDHGTIWSLHLEELDDEGGASSDNLGRQVAEGTVLNAHDGQLAAEGQLEREAVQVRVVIEVQFLQVFQCT